jgi:fructokinase
MMARTDPHSHASRAAPAIIVGLGEVLWDVFDAEAHFGGAPANFACHAAAFGARAYMVSGVGDDPLGEQALAVLQEHGVNVEAMIRIPNVPTGSVRVSLDAKGLPHYIVHRDVAWDRITWTATMEQLAGRADAVCFGTIAQREQTSRQTIYRFLDATMPHCLRVFDVNLRQDYFSRAIIEQSLHRSTVLKLNDEELSVFTDLFDLDGAVDTLKITQLLERFDLQLVILTLGDRGAILRDRTQTVAVAAQPVQVLDTVGAGDAFTATITMGLWAGCDLGALAEHACRVAGYVCAHEGAVPKLPPALRTLSAVPQPETEI